jgi:hypothetical protein
VLCVSALDQCVGNSSTRATLQHHVIILDEESTGQNVNPYRPSTSCGEYTCDIRTSNFYFGINFSTGFGIHLSDQLCLNKFNTQQNIYLCVTVGILLQLLAVPPQAFHIFLSYVKIHDSGQGCLIIQERIMT